ncbi:hypothetical protein F442_20917 [Phytophthora nicotianae P10297]|uniref:PiggyBac transposable element-derived protein domain-containing protein n=1 Tax=Phytophthora nicotianae P10297 TaxID=1317064 RepID=W2Y5L1_PHYNI|nr:hypothetical protein F442_20917 [Phytophthora nicotianae P10297]
MDDNSLPPEAGNEQVTGEAPLATEGDDFEEPIVGSIDTSDWYSTEDEATSKSTLRSTTSSTANGYIAAFKVSSGLHLVDEEETKRAYRNHGELGLFSLFITQEIKRSLGQWTNEALSIRGLAPTTIAEFDAYLGLEFAMSICPLNEISDFWSEKRFLGQHDFVETMGRTRFQNIRSSLKIYPPTPPVLHVRVQGAHEVSEYPQQSQNPPTNTSCSPPVSLQLHRSMQALPARPAVQDGSNGVVDAAGDNYSTTTTTSPSEYDTSRDPLWHSRILLRHIQRKFADVAIPYGVSSLDENSIRTKARTAAKSFIPTKPDKNAIRFYAVVGWESLCQRSRVVA